MDFTPLTPEQEQSFKEDGFLLVRNAIDPKTTNAIKEACDRLAHSFLRKGRIVNKPWYNDLDLRPGLLEEEALYNLVANSSTVSLITQLLSPNIHLHSTALTYKIPENPDFPPYRRGWHRDAGIPKDLGHANLPMVGIKVCYCLTDFNAPDSGMTLMARKSHLYDKPLTIPEDQVDPSNFEICDLELNDGDALLFENRIFHTATPNRSDKIAKRLIYGYTYRWMKPEVYLDNPNPKLFEKADLITRQLLGWYRDVETRPWALEDWARQHNILKEKVPWIVRV